MILVILLIANQIRAACCTPVTTSFVCVCGLDDWVGLWLTQYLVLYEDAVLTDDASVMSASLPL